MNPQFTSNLTNSEKETIVQDILTYLQSHQEVPADLIMDIQQKFMKSNNQPTPPKLNIFNINELLDPFFSQTMDDYNTNNFNLPTMTPTKKVHFNNTPKLITNKDETQFDATQKNTRTKARPTTQTLNDRPNVQPSGLPASCEQSNKYITEQQAHQYLDLVHCKISKS